MAALCQKHREEREARAAAAAAEAAATDPDGSQAGSDGPSLAGSGSSGSGASMDGTAPDAVAVLQQYLVSARQALPTPLCASIAGAANRPQQAQQAQQQKVPAWHSGASGQVAPAQRGGKLSEAAGRQPNCCSLSVTGVAAGVAAGCTDSARTSLAGTAQPASGSSNSSSKGQPVRRPLSAGPRSSRMEPVTIEAVIERRQAAAAAAGSVGSPPASPHRQASLSASAALAAWQAASRQQSAASEASAAAGQQGRAAPLAAQPWQQAAWDAFGRPPGACPSSSTRFLDRVATFVGAQREAQLAAAAQLAQQETGTVDSLCGGGSGQLGDSACGSLRSSGSGGAVSGSASVAQELSSAAAALESTYIPPAMLSALHTVRLTPRLLSGLCPPAPPTGAVQQRKLGKPGRPALGGADATAAVARAAGGIGGKVGQAAFMLPPTPGAQHSPVAGQHPPAARHVPETRCSPCQAQLGGNRGTPRAAARAGQLGYRDVIQQQAVKSVADLIADMIKEQKL